MEIASSDDWPADRWPNFTRAEFACRHTGRCEVDERFMDLLQQTRTAYGRPMFVTSGYRDPSHPIEARKTRPGAHALGMAADVACHGGDAYAILRRAIGAGMTGIGVQQKGDHDKRYLHLDAVPESHEWIPRPMLWSY